jgi:hypothetical protein
MNLPGPGLRVAAGSSRQQQQVEKLQTKAELIDHWLDEGQ